MSFSFEEEKNGKMSFVDVEISRENGKFVQRFTAILLLVMFILILRVFYLLYKNGMLYTLVHRCFTLWSDRSKFHRERLT